MQPPIPPMNKEKLSQLMDGDWHELNPSDCVVGICNDDALRSKWARYHLIRDAIKNEPVHSDLTLVSRICAAVEDEPVYSNITPFSPSLTSQNSADNDTDQPDSSGEHAVGNTVSETVNVNPLPAELSTAKRNKMSWLGTGMSGFAVAASVAVVTVVGMNVWQGQTVAPDDASVVASRAMSGIDAVNVFSRQAEGVPLPVVEFVANTGSYWVSPQTAERVNNEDKLNMFLSQHIENSPTSSREGLLPYSRLVAYDELPASR